MARALGNPLMLSLARVAYSDTEADPSELLDRSFRTEEDIQAFLIQRFVPSSFPDSPGANDDYSAGKVSKWLGFLARELESPPSGGIAWWRVSAAAEKSTVAVTMLLIVGVSGLLWWAMNAGAALLYGLATMLFGMSLLFRRGGKPSVYDINLRRFLQPFAIAVGLGAMIGLFNFIGSGMVEALYSGAVLGIFFGLVLGVVETLTAPSDHVRSVSPGSTLRSDRLVSLLVGLVVGLALGALLFASSGGPFERHKGGAVGMLVGLSTIIFLPWGQFAVARAVLGIRGKLPIRLMTFLQVAHKRGVLRQSGALYEFRHALLKEHFDPKAGAGVATERQPIGPRDFGMMAMLSMRARIILVAVVVTLSLPAGYIAGVGSEVLLPDMPTASRVVGGPLLAVVTPLVLASMNARYWLLMRIVRRVVNTLFLLFYGPLLLWYAGQSVVNRLFSSIAIVAQLVGLFLVGVAFWHVRVGPAEPVLQPADGSTPEEQTLNREPAKLVEQFRRHS